MRINAAIASIVLIIVSLVATQIINAVFDIALPFWILTAPVLLLAAWMTLRAPPRRFAAWGYRIDPEELHLKRGVYTQEETVVPLGRVQHIDVGQGAIERMCGVCHLTLHTAGTAHSSVTLPGLTRETAEGLRDEIRRHIRQDIG
jgi:uncharacterized protein